MVKASIEVVKNVDGRVESGVVIVQGRKLRFNNVWDDDGLLRRIEFDGRYIPTFAELYLFMNEKFIESIRKIGELGWLGSIDHIGQIDYVNVGTIWVRPISATGSGWQNPDWAFDGLLDTTANYAVPAGSWSNFLIFTVNSMTANSVMFHVNSSRPADFQIDVDVYDGGAWIDVYEGTYTDYAWNLKTFTSQTVTQVRVRFNNAAGSIQLAFLRELLIGNTLNVVVSATDLDIRDLTSASDSVEVKQATASNLNANVFTKHDNKTYKTAVFDASASGNLVAAVAAKVIKLHALTIQAQGTVVVNLNNGVGGTSLMEWSFQAREGAVVPMANAPAYWAKTSVNTILYVTLSAAQTVTITAIYSDDDAA